MTETEYAVVDIGSNSLRLMQGLLSDGQWRFYPKRMATTRLARGLAETGHLWSDGIANSLAVMEEWNHNLQGIPVCAVATSAVREAKDGQAFLAEVRWRFGWHCRIVSGQEEGALSFVGATSHVSDNTIVAVLDIGGGSTETVLGKDCEVSWSHSYPLGAVRLTETDGSTAEGLQAIRHKCDSAWLRQPVKPETLIGVGGTLTSLAAMDARLEIYDPAVTDGYVLSRDKVSEWLRRLANMSDEERKCVPGLASQRSTIILAGLTIAESYMTYYDIDEITVSERDLLEGVFYKQAFYDSCRIYKPQ